MTQLDGPRAAAAFPRLVSGAQAYHLAQGTWDHADVTHVVGRSRPSIDLPAEMRRSARALLLDRITPARLADVLLALSEIVVNAVSHPLPRAGEEVVVHLAVAADGSVRAEVCDAGLGFVVGTRAVPTDGAPGGRGLLIVDRVASRWGTSAAIGHCVWFELDA